MISVATIASNTQQMEKLSKHTKKLYDCGMQISDVTNFFGISKSDDNSVVDAQTPKVLREPEEPRKVLYAWEANARPELKSLSKKKLKTLTVVGVAICVVLIAMQEFFLILGVLSLIFVSYMLTQTPPESVKYELTNKGVKFGEIFYSWENLKFFFFTNEAGSEAVAIDTVNTVPARLYLTIRREDRERVHEILHPFVNFLEEAPKTFVDKAYSSVMDKLDLND